MPPQGSPIGPVAIGAIAVLCNLPLGYLRQGARRYSAPWFLWIHLSIPLIAWLRIREGLSPWWIPLFVGCAVTGQVAGGWLRPPGTGGK